MPTITELPAPNYPDPSLAYSYSASAQSAYSGYAGYGGGYGSGYTGYGAWGTAGIAAGYPKGDARPTKPALMGVGGMQFIPDGGVVLSKAIDDVIGNLGNEVYDLMSQDDAVSAALTMLAYSIMGGDIHVEPAIVAEPGERVDGTTDPQRRKDIEDAKLYAEQVRRSIDRVPDFLDQLEAILAEGLIRGSGLGDPEWEVVQGPTDEKPLTLLKSIQCRHYRSWAMVVNKYGQFEQVAGFSWEGPKLYQRDRFLVYVNSPRNGDPRGTSDLRPAYDAWNFKTQARPERGKYIATWANPTVVIRYDNTTTPTYPIDPATGQEDTTQALLVPHAQAERVAANVHGNSWMAIPIPWESELVESKNDGGAFAAHEEDCNKAIIQAILLSSRTLSEAAHGSKADSDTSKDTTMIKVARREKTFTKAIERGFCYVQTLMNHGEDAANRLCPKIKFPDTNAGTVADLITAYTGAGWKTVPRQAAYIDSKFGLPVRSADEIDEAKRQADAAQQAVIDAAKAKAGGIGGNTGSMDGKPGDAKPVEAKVKPGGKTPGNADAKPTDDPNGKPGKSPRASKPAKVAASKPRAPAKPAGEAK